MNAQADEKRARDLSQDDSDPDPLAGLRDRGDALADLVFGSLSRTASTTPRADRDLAFLPNEALELDLSDPTQRRFGNYELLELIGEGGMGVVYRAHQSGLDRDVAVKLLSAGPWASREFIERFLREAQNAARMQHPNIVAIYEVGDAEGLYFFSMRLVRGDSLATLLKREGKLDPRRAATLLRTIAEAVDYAHHLGVLHLDLKPANVLLDEDGIPHVADFGLARRLDGALSAECEEVSGTPSYMAPEQVQVHSRKIAAPTDVWGLGAILYELVTGAPPFLGDSPQTTLQLVLDGELRSPRAHVPDLSRDLEAIIGRCMAKDVAARYASARDLADDLGRFLDNRAVRARPLNAPQRLARWTSREPRLAAMAAGLFVALLAGVVASTLQSRRADANARHAQASTQLANERLWDARLDQASTALRDGHNYAALAPLAANIREREALGLDAREDRIRIAATLNTAPRLIDDIALGADISGIAVSPDGGIIAVATDDETLRLIDAATGAERWRTRFSGATHSWTAHNPGTTIRLEMLRFSADGRYVTGRQRLGVEGLIQPMGIDEILFDAGSGKLLAPPPALLSDFRDATFSADGRTAILRNIEHALLVRTADWQPLGQPQSINRGGWLLPNGGRHMLVTYHGFTTLEILDAAFKPQRKFEYDDTQRLTSWAASPDGATAILGHLDGSIERVDLAGGRREALQPRPLGRIGMIVYSDDGRWFGAVADTGEVLTWDAATFKPAAPPLRLNTANALHRDQLALDPATGSVLASSDLEMALWHVIGPNKPALRLATDFPQTNADRTRAFSLYGTGGLVASDGGRGELRLWRVQATAAHRLRAPPLATPELDVHDGHGVVIEGSALYLADLRDGHAVSPRIALPQMPAFAALTPDGKWLVASAGPRLLVYDATNWTLLQSIELPNDPARILLHPDSRRALALFADYADGHNRETGRYFDLAGGAPSPASFTLHPHAGLRFDANGRTLLQWSADGVALLDADSLKPRWAHAPGENKAVFDAPPPGKPNREIVMTSANFSAGGTRIDVLVTTDLNLISRDRDGNETSAAWLWQYEASGGRELGHFKLSDSGNGDDFAVLPGRDAVLLPRTLLGLSLWERGHDARTLPSPKGFDEFAALALSPDANIVARAGSGAIMLTSLRSFDWLTPPLPSGRTTTLRGEEHPLQLAFTRDGETLIGRSQNGEWLRWNVAPDRRPAEWLVREAALFNPDAAQANHKTAAHLPAADRQALRAADPGSPVRTKPTPPVVIPRQPEAGPLLFDLSAFYNQPLQCPCSENFENIFPEFTPGLHRFLGTDYDARGTIDLLTAFFGAGPDKPPARVAGIRPPLPRLKALNVLVAGGAKLARMQARPYAFVELSYRDGSRERLPLLYLRDINERWATRQDTSPAGEQPRVATRPREYGETRKFRRGDIAFAVRLTNPHPEREIDSIALEAVNEAWSSPSFFAITAEPLPP